MSDVTIIIPYKTNFKYLILALNSIFRQTYKNFTVIIIYDNEDKSDLIKLNRFIKKKKIKSKIKLIVNKKNLGAGESRNLGIKKSNSKYIAFLDSDDLWLKDKLKKQINFMKLNKLDISHTSYSVINSKNKIISDRIAMKSMTFQNLIRSCDIGLSTVIVKKKLLKKNNFFFPNISTKEDYILWLRIISKIKLIKGLNIKLTYYRKTNKSLSSNKLIAIINGYKVYRKYMNFGIIKSFLLLVILSFNSLKKNIL